MFLTGQMSKVKSGLRAISERWRGRSNQQVIPQPAPKPKITNKQVDFSPVFVDDPLSFRGCQSRAKMNRTREHRHEMKKFHKHQARCNKNYRVKA